MQQSMTVLNRTIRWQGHGIEYEPDQRHAELIMESMGVSSGKGVSTPVVADDLQNPASRMHSAEIRLFPDLTRQLHGYPGPHTAVT